MSDYVVLPRKPTPAMLEAFNKMAQCEGYIEEGYAAMLEAAPPSDEIIGGVT